MQAAPVHEPAGGGRSAEAGGAVRTRPTVLAPAVLLVGLALTGFLTWASFRSTRSDNARLLQLQVRQVGSVLSADLSSLHSELSDAVEAATADPAPAAFRTFVAKDVGVHGFASESLWYRSPSGNRLVAEVGGPPRLVQDGMATAFFATLRPRLTLQVTGVLPGQPPRIGYAELAPGDSGRFVYAESLLPAHRRLSVAQSSPFSQLAYALYIGRRATSSALIGASAPVPLRGQTASATVPFGDRHLTVVARARTMLSSSLTGALPWIVLGVGTALAVLTAGTVEYVFRRRRRAEVLAGQVQALYDEQRAIATSLQVALLPRELPTVPGLEIAARYVAGTKGVDVGGDWYDVVPLPGGRVVFVVGDVSGRGIGAATVMAPLRFAGRGFALEGHQPAAIIDQLRGVLDVGYDAHFATVSCGLIDVAGHELVLANAGHPPPVLLTDRSAGALAVPPCPPVGVDGTQGCATVQFRIPEGATLIVYTDGLIERRGESIDDGIRRLESAVRGLASMPVDGVLDAIVSNLTGNSPDDDVALLGIRWTGNASERSTAPDWRGARSPAE